MLPFIDDFCLFIISHFFKLSFTRKMRAKVRASYRPMQSPVLEPRRKTGAAHLTEEHLVVNESLANVAATRLPQLGGRCKADASLLVPQSG